MGKARDWGDIGAEGGPGAIRREGDDPATDIPVDDAPPQPNGNGGAYLTEEELRGPARKQIVLPPPPDRASLTVSAWLDKDIPERDFLLGGVMCTTSRWFIFGETGIGKTLIAMELAAAIAVAAAFLKWPGQRRVRVMYLDGELPMETFKERMQLIAARHGSDLQFYGYNREDLGDDRLPPLNTDAGQAWLKREIAAVKPDLIIFDSIMCLLIGSMSEESTWMPVRPFVRWLSAQRIAQVWLHHANDFGKSFGDKTREWEMEAVIKLSKVEGDETAVLFEFVKKRLCSPANAAQFAPLIIRPGEDWHFEIAKASCGGKQSGDVEMIRDEFIRVYDHLADGVTKSLGLDDRSSVRKVSVAAIRDGVKDHGLLDLDEKGNIERVSRNHFSRAKKHLLRRGTFAERKGHIWRL